MDCSLRGNTLLFGVERRVKGSQEVLSFEGQIAGDTITGKILQRGTDPRMNRWQVTRDLSTRVSIAE
jgi:hypothetical protein